MRELPRNIDADVVIEISRHLDDHPKSMPVRVHQLAALIRQRFNASLPDKSIEELIVEMATTRRLPMLFDPPETDMDNVISIDLARASRAR